MTEAKRLRAQARRCLRLAKEAGAKDVAETMRELAANYVARARSLEHELPDSPAATPTVPQAPEPH
jgi:hypothetical protein